MGYIFRYRGVDTHIIGISCPRRSCCWSQELRWRIQRLSMERDGLEGMYVGELYSLKRDVYIVF